MLKGMELVDIVKPDGTRLHTISKQQAHAEGLLHSCVIGVVRRPDGTRFVVRQNAHKQDAGQYVNPVGGHVQAGESLEDALRREVLEEIGWRDFTHTLIGAVVYDRMVLGRRENHLFNVFAINSAEPFIINDESVEVRGLPHTDYQNMLRNEPHLFGPPHHFVEQTFPQFFAGVTR